jgi:parallel beta-helix repeat protein
VIRSLATLTVAPILAAVLATSCNDTSVSSPPTIQSDVGAVTGAPVTGPVVALPAVPPVPAIGSFATDADPHLLFVDPVHGDDGNDGQTSAQSWASLQHGLDQIGPGDTLYLMSGDYRGELHPGTSHFLLERSGTPEEWIRIAAAPGQSPVVVAEAGNALEVRGSYVEVADLRIIGRGFDKDNHYGWGLLTRSNRHVRFIGNTISDMAVGGITSVEATNLEIVENTVFDNAFWGPEQGSGISVWHSRDAGTDPGPDGYHDRIIANTVYGNENKVFSQWRDRPIITDGNGIIVDSGNETGYTGRTLIANNVVFDNGGRGVLVLDSSRVDVTHNTTYHNGSTEGLEGGPAELVSAGANDVRFFDNLAWSRPGAAPVQVRHSRQVTSGGNAYVGEVPRGTVTGADLVLPDNPGLANPSDDPAVADFRPLASSPLLGRAVAVDPFVPLDADRKTRPVEGAAIGAYERVSAGAHPS